ncbi:MAG TPA: hypothetical protein VGQ09_11110 [Chitinophagaceae bacterium]|jgi:hypothetical protein|nr:hypothetical protein [Chitinophagaceae bacterium]
MIFSQRTLPVFISIIIFSQLVFSSCLTPRKIDKWIDKKYGNTVQNKIKNNDYITIKAPSTSQSDIVAMSQKRKAKLLPLLFYWKWEYGTTSTLNQAIPNGYFNSAILPYANIKKLRDKLNGQKLELTINKIPASFSVVDKGGLVFLVLFYVTWDDIFMDPEKQDLIVSYKLSKDNAETKSGTITISDRNKPLHVKVFHSVKKTFWSYLDQYNYNIQQMSKELIDKLIKEL